MSRCKKGHDYDVAKYGNCPICGEGPRRDGLRAVETAPENAPEAPKLARGGQETPEVRLCATCAVNGRPGSYGLEEGRSCGFESQAEYGRGCKHYLEADGYACPKCIHKNEICINEERDGNSTSCPSFHFIGWPEEVADDTPSCNPVAFETPERKELVEKLLEIIDEWEATEAEKKEVAADFSAKVKALEANMLSVRAQIAAIDHPAPLFPEK